MDKIDHTDNFPVESADPDAASQYDEVPVKAPTPLYLRAHLADDEFPTLQSKSTTISTAGMKEDTKLTELKIGMVESEEADQKPSGEASPVFEILDEAKCPSPVLYDVLSGMYNVKQNMIDFETYIRTQKDKKKPLHQWERYSGYCAISRAVSTLDGAVAKLEPIHLHNEDAKFYLRQATHFSLMVSKIAVFVMGVMSTKMETCVDDIEESGMSSEGKDNAKALVTEELKKLIKHSTRATSRIYATTDYLRDSLRFESIEQSTRLPGTSSINLETNTQVRLSRNKWFWTATALVLGLAASVTSNLIAPHRYGWAKSNQAAEPSSNSTALYAQMMDLILHTHAVTNLTGELYAAKLQEIDQRYKELSTSSEAHGLRIDNLVDSLGPTNENGVYYSATKELDFQTSHHIETQIRKIADRTNFEMQQLRHQLEQMRKKFHRMDIRLTKRLDKLHRVP